MDEEGPGSMLCIHHRDLASPVGTTFYYYVSDRLADSRDVTVVCRRRPDERGRGSGNDADLHAIYTGDVPVLSGVAFHLLATLYVAVLSVRHRYDVTYCSQSSMVQGWVSSLLAGSRLVVGLGSVPVRQAETFRDASPGELTLSRRVTGGLLSLYARAVGAVLRDADEVVCLTEGIREVTERVYGLDLSGAHVIGMGVDVETFATGDPPDPVAAGRRSGGADPPERPDGGDGRTVTYLGAVRSRRNLAQVIRALPDLDADVTFQVAGTGPEPEVAALKREARRLGVADRVEWLGYVPHESVPDLLARTDVAVSPLPDVEAYRISFPAKLLEYMAAGAVVVATDIPPHRRLIDDGENGFLYDGSRAALVATLSSCLDDEATLRAVGRRAHETARSHDWDAVVGEYERAVFGSAPGEGVAD